MTALVEDGEDAEREQEEAKTTCERPCLLWMSSDQHAGSFSTHTHARKHTHTQADLPTAAAQW